MTESTSFVLNADEVKEFDELAIERMALNDTLRVALNYSANRNQEITRRNNVLWRRLGEKHGFSPDALWVTAQDKRGMFIRPFNAETDKKPWDVNP